MSPWLGFYCRLRASVCSLWRGGDQLINWVTGPLRGNRMQIESGHRGDSRKVSVLSRALRGGGSLPVSLHKGPGVIQSERRACIKARADWINTQACVHATTHSTRWRDINLYLPLVECSVLAGLAPGSLKELINFTVCQRGEREGRQGRRKDVEESWPAISPSRRQERCRSRVGLN